MPSISVVVQPLFQYHKVPFLIVAHLSRSTSEIFLIGVCRRRRFRYCRLMQTVNHATMKLVSLNVHARS